MESQYVYQKKRADFGKHPNFTDRPSELIVDIEPNEDERQVTFDFYNCSSNCDIELHCPKSNKYWCPIHSCNVRA